MRSAFGALLILFASFLWSWMGLFVSHLFFIGIYLYNPAFEFMSLAFFVSVTEDLVEHIDNIQRFVYKAETICINL